MIEENSTLANLNVSNNITIGEGVTFVGSISANGKAFINGNVTGQISVDDLQVGQYGVVKGKIKSREMDIHGEVHEDIHCAEHLLVYSTGLINGKLIYGELEIQKGGRVTGSMDQKKKR
jgi:cytoskeletal protein CcmA (bactofilin family)